MKYYVTSWQKWIIGLLLCSVAGICAANDVELKPMTTNETELFSKLYRIYPNPEFGVKAPVVQGRAIFDIRIWSVNMAEECDSRNFNAVCKGHRLYITVSDSEEGGKTFGVSLSKSFGWNVLKIEYRGSCVAIWLEERDSVERFGKMDWIRNEHVICMSPEGLLNLP